MSLVITLFVREGIVMASDSRLTLNQTRKDDNNKESVQLAVGMSDANYKTFLVPTGVGISTWGAAAIGGVPIAGYIESFINDVAVPGKLAVDSLASELLKHFRTFTPQPDTGFIVAGYKKTNTTTEQQVWVLSVVGNTCARVNQADVQGAQWGGETDILARLINPVATLKPDGAIEGKLPVFAIPWNFFTLQDAIDFATFAIRATSEAHRFQARAKTVGGPIDVLVLKPGDTKWIRHRQLTAGP